MTTLPATSASPVVAASSFPLALVGCGKAKASSPQPARWLYTSTLFRLSLAHAEVTAERVWIVSALHGLVDPHEELSPYALALGELSPEVQQGWARGVVEQLGEGHERRVLLLAGGAYALLLGAALGLAGWVVEAPLAGLSIGRRLRWLAQHTPARGAA